MYGYKTWIGGLVTGRWDTQSTLEKRIIKINGPVIVHDWVTVEGTGLNIFGGSLSHGHGRPTSFYICSNIIEADAIFLMNDVQIVEIYELAKTKDNKAIDKYFNEFFSRQ